MWRLIVPKRSAQNNADPSTTAQKKLAGLGAVVFCWRRSFGRVSDRGSRQVQVKIMINKPSPPFSLEHKQHTSQQPKINIVEKRRKNITTSRPSALHPSRTPLSTPPATNILNNLHHRDPTPATSMFSLISTAATTALKRGPRRPRSGQAATDSSTYIMRTLARQPCLPASLSDLAQQRRSIIMNGERSQPGRSQHLRKRSASPFTVHRSPFKVRLHPHETRDWGFCRRRPVRLARMAHV